MKGHFVWRAPDSGTEHTDACPFTGTGGGMSRGVASSDVERIGQARAHLRIFRSSWHKKLLWENLGLPGALVVFDVKL